MAKKPEGNSWTPIIRLDLTTAGEAAFVAVWDTFVEHRKARAEAGDLPAFPFKADGWYDITPEMAEAALLHSHGNRRLRFQKVKQYAFDMAAGDWKPTGQSICCADEGLDEGHHRTLACYLSGQTFRSYVVTSVPKIVNAFAYYDQGVGRNNADALQIAGWNGDGKILSKAISDLAVRYENGLLGVGKQPRMKPVNPREALSYLKQHPDMQQAAKLMLGTFDDAVDVIKSKEAAVVFAWLVLRAYDEAVLDDFCTALGTGANLAEDSPILAVRNRLMQPEGKTKTPARERLAYTCKAFLMHVGGQRLARGRSGKIIGLMIDHGEDFPRIDPLPVAEAAE